MPGQKTLSEKQWEQQLWGQQHVSPLLHNLWSKSWSFPPPPLLLPLLSGYWVHWLECHQDKLVTCFRGVGNSLLHCVPAKCHKGRQSVAPLMSSFGKKAPNEWIPPSPSLHFWALLSSNTMRSFKFKQQDPCRYRQFCSFGVHSRVWQLPMGQILPAESGGSSNWAGLHQKKNMNQDLHLSFSSYLVWL